MLGVLKSVSKHSIIYGIGDLLGKGLSLILLPLYLHYLSPEEYGTLDLLDMTTYIVSILLAVGIAQAVMRYYFEYQDQERRDQVVSVALISLWVMAIISMPLLWYKSDFFSNLVFDSPDYTRLFTIIFASMVVGLINEIPRTLMRVKQQSVTFITISIIRMLIAITLNVLFVVKYRWGVEGVLIGNLTAQIVIGAIMTVWILKQIKLSWSYPLLKEMVRYSFPLAWTWLAMFLLNYGDRFLLQKLAGLYEVGIYSLAYKFGMLANMLILNPFMQTWFPKQFEIANEPDARKTYGMVFTYFMFVMVFCSLGITVLIKDTVILMASEDYYSAVPYVPVILLAYLAYGIYNFVQFGVHFEKKTRYLGITTVIVAIINIGLNFILIPRLGIWGATIATGVSFALLPGIIFPISQKLYHIPYEYFRVTKLLAVAGVMFYLATLISFDSIILTLIVKFIFALCYPLALYFTRFYSAQEKITIGGFVRQGLGLVSRRLRGSNG